MGMRMHVGTHMPWQACECRRTACRTWFSPSTMSWGLDVGCQARGKVPLPIETPHQPLFCLIEMQKFFHILNVNLLLPVLHFLFCGLPYILKAVHLFAFTLNRKKININGIRF